MLRGDKENRSDNDASRRSNLASLDSAAATGAAAAAAAKETPNMLLAKLSLNPNNATNTANEEEPPSLSLAISTPGTGRRRMSFQDAPTPANTPRDAGILASDNFSSFLQSRTTDATFLNPASFMADLNQKAEAAASGSGSSGSGGDDNSKQGGRKERGTRHQETMGAMLAQNPQLMAALQGKLGALMGTSSGYIESLPKPIRNRIYALEELDKDRVKMDFAFRQEVLALERKYEALYAPLFDKRADIVSGNVEPPVVEGKEDSDEEIEDDDQEVDPALANAKGVPEFWLTCMKNSQVLETLLMEHDEDALKHLQDVRVHMLPDNPGFRLEFHFGENDYFTDSVLSKTYFLQDAEDQEDVVFDHCEFSEIHWKPNKNLTVKVENKKQRHKTSKKTRIVKRTVPQNSFFNFFKDVQVPPAATDDEEDPDEEQQEEALREMLEDDFAIGEFFKEELIPNAVHWFTGEAAAEYAGDEEDYEDDEEDYELDEDDEEDDDDEDDEDDEDNGPPAPTRRGASGKPSRRQPRGGQPPNGGGNPECNQQ